MLSRTLIRSARLLRTPTAARLVRPSMALRSFSVAPMVLNKAALSSADAELVASLTNEIKVESEAMAEEAEAEAKLGGEDTTVLDQFLKNSGFVVEAQEGSDLVALVKTDGPESVKVYFSLFDITNNESITDAEEYEGEQGAETEGQEAVAEEAQEEEDFDADLESPIRVRIVVERPAGSLAVEATVLDDMFLVQYVMPFESAELATANTAEAEHARRQVYQGPVFSTLDPALQNAFEQYLEARGVNDDLALFIGEYASSRENKEYISWLSRVKKVVE